MANETRAVSRERAAGSPGWWTGVVWGGLEKQASFGVGDGKGSSFVTDRGGEEDRSRARRGHQL